MPYVQIRTNKEISKEKELAIKERLGRAITLFGKTEQWLMVECVPNCHMYFAGEEVETAYVGVKLLGKATEDAYNSFTKEVTDMLVENGEALTPDHVYVSYDEYDRWGWNGSNL